MARKKIAPEQEAPTSAQLEELAVRMAEIDTKYGDDAPYDRSRIEQEARFYLRQSAEAMLEAGKRLILLKEHEDHGQFLDSLERIGLEKRIAQKMMQAAVKLLDNNGALKAKSISLLPVTKLYDLALLDNEDIDQLAENGSVAGLTLEAVDKMTTRELRQEVKRLNKEKKELEENTHAEREVHDQLLQDKDKKINQLYKELNTRDDSTKWQQKSLELLQRLQTATPKFSQVVSDFSEALAEISGMEVGDWEQSQMILMEQAKFSIDIMLNDLNRLTDQVKFMAPQGNAIFHQLNDLRLLWDDDTPITRVGPADD